MVVVRRSGIKQSVNREAEKLSAVPDVVEVTANFVSSESVFCCATAVAKSLDFATAVARMQTRI